MVTSGANSPVGSNSSPFYANAIRERFWKTHLKRVGVRYRGPNQCHYTFSQLLSMGVVPLHWISNHVGHATITMIQQRYGQVDSQRRPKCSSAIEKQLDLEHSQASP
ncbi:MAG: hypothetical protein L0J73_02295 [Halomonas sp.]|uniref:hypothetical protein n=1 Tax=unclassified Halomonas TaxID=2609666 RepID=UPI002652F77B|nr:hypothetical protein [Halomonas sp.]